MGATQQCAEHERRALSGDGMNRAGSILCSAFSLLPVVMLRQYAVLCAVALGTAALVVSTPAMAKTPSQVFEEVSASVVVVEAYDARGTQIGQGSGVIIAPGEVATNCHVLKDADRLQVRHGQVRHSALVRLSDADRDLCQIIAAGLTARPAAIGATKVLKVGSRVYAVGAPRGLELTLSEGIVSGLREVAGGRFIQTTAPISPGSSGGGLFDENGALVGLTTFYVSEGQNLNFALPVEWLRELHARHKAQTPVKDSTVDWLAKAAALESRQDWEGGIACTRPAVGQRPAQERHGVVQSGPSQWPPRSIDEGRGSLPAGPAAGPRVCQGVVRPRLGLCRDGSPGPGHGGVPEAERAGCGSSRRVFPEDGAPLNRPIPRDPSPNH
jgi:hypothetical protein